MEKGELCLKDAMDNDDKREKQKKKLDPKNNKASKNKSKKN